jgi:hypothetical protein
VEGLEASLILLAKRIGWDTSYRQLLCRNLIPLLDEWRAGAVSDLMIGQVIIIMGMFQEDKQVSGPSKGRQCSCENAIQPLLYLNNEDKF